MNNLEQLKPSNEYGAESRQTAAERGLELQKKQEASAESSAEHHAERIETARHEAEAIFSREAGSERSGNEPTGLGRVIKKVTNQERALAYQQTMSRIRTEMSAPARAFSTFIHQRSVERASGILGNTVARPNAVLSGSTCALALVSSVYIIAKIFGYPLSGFETIGAFVFGWIVGLIYDYARAMITGHTQ